MEIEKECGCKMQDIVDPVSGDWIGIDQVWCATHSTDVWQNFALATNSNK